MPLRVPVASRLLWLALLSLSASVARCGGPVGVRVLRSPHPYHGQGTSLSAADSLRFVAEGDGDPDACTGMRTFSLRPFRGGVEALVDCRGGGHRFSGGIDGDISIGLIGGVHCDVQLTATATGVPFTFRVLDHLACVTDGPETGGRTRTNSSTILTDVWPAPSFAAPETAWTRDVSWSFEGTPWFYYLVHVPSFTGLGLEASQSVLRIELFSSYATNVYVLHHANYPLADPGFPLLPSPDFHTWSSRTGWPVGSSTINITGAGAGVYAVSINCHFGASCGGWRFSAEWSVPDLIGVVTMRNGVAAAFNVSSSSAGHGLPAAQPLLSRFTVPPCYSGCYFRLVLLCAPGSLHTVVYAARDSLSPSASAHSHRLSCAAGEWSRAWKDEASVTGAWYFSVTAGSEASGATLADPIFSSSPDAPLPLPTLRASFSPYAWDLSDRPTQLALNGAAHLDTLFPDYRSFFQFKIERDALAASSSSSSSPSFLQDSGSDSVSVVALELRLLLPALSPSLQSCAGGLHIRVANASCGDFACVGMDPWQAPLVHTDAGGVATWTVPLPLNRSDPDSPLWFAVGVVIQSRDAAQFGACPPDHSIPISLRLHQPTPTPPAPRPEPASSSSSSSSGDAASAPVDDSSSSSSSASDASSAAVDYSSSSSGAGATTAGDSADAADAWTSSSSTAPTGSASGNSTSFADDDEEGASGSWRPWLWMLLLLPVFVVLAFLSYRRWRAGRSAGAGASPQFVQLERITSDHSL